MKKHFAAILGTLTALLTALTLCACSNGGDNVDDSNVFDPSAISVATAYNQAAELGFVGTLDEFIELISGKDGADGVDGRDGKDGKNGVDGKNGRGISSVHVLASGELIVAFTDGSTVNAGSVVIKCAHTYGAWSVGAAATCTSMGYNVRTCSKCGNIDYEFTDKLGHDYGDAVAFKEATCTEKGLDILTCLRCGDTKSRITDELGHELVDTSDVCLRCGEMIFEKYYHVLSINDGTEYSLRCVEKKLSGEVTVPAEYNGKPITAIMDSAFSNCKNITKIIIPDTVTSIGNTAFYNCENLVEIVIPDTVKKIGRSAFNNCRSLAEIMIPDGVTSIGSHTFAWCTALEEINIHKSLTEISEAAFVGVDFERIAVDPENPVYTVKSNSIIDKTTKTLILGSSSTIIPSDGSVEHIGAYAFFHLKNKFSILIPNGVKSIGHRAFEGCENVDRVELPASLTSIGSYALDADIANGITVALQNPVYKSVNDCLIEIESKTIIKGCGKSVIPDTDDVERIGERAFIACSAIESVIIPENITRIGIYAFSGCSSLSAIRFPNILHDIGQSAFDRTAYYNDPNNWTDGAMYIDDHLICVSDVDEFVVRDGTRVIADSAFWCNRVSKVTIADSVKVIGSYAFAHCGNLGHVTIGSGAETILSYAFYDCVSLESVEFKDPIGWSRETTVGEPERIDAAELSDQSKAAELVREASISDNKRFEYMWSKAAK